MSTTHHRCRCHCGNDTPIHVMFNYLLCIFWQILSLRVTFCGVFNDKWNLAVPIFMKSLNWHSTQMGWYGLYQHHIILFLGEG
jgi:hypothetical protein